MDKQLFYDSTEGIYWYEGEDGQAKFYAWAEEATVEEAESAVDKIFPKEQDDESL